MEYVNHNVMLPDSFISQQDIAEKAGVSVMSVSRALSGKPGVSVGTAERIRALAKEMGYVPNPFVQSLIRTRKQPAMAKGLSLGWYGFTSGFGRSSLTEKMYDTFQEYYKGSADMCARRGFRLEEIAFPEIEVSRAESIFTARGIRGMLLGPQGLDHPQRPSPDSSLYVVQIGRSGDNPVHDRIVTDSYRSMLSCIQVLRDTGYSRIGYLDDWERERRNEFRHHGAFLTESPDNASRIRFRENSHPPEGVLHEFIRHSNPDALIVGGNALLGVLQNHPSPPPFLALSRNGLPGWVSGMDVRHRDIGAEAARRLIDAIVGPQPASLRGHSVSLNEVWHQGQSHLPR